MKPESNEFETEFKELALSNEDRSRFVEFVSEMEDLSVSNEDEDEINRQIEDVAEATGWGAQFIGACRERIAARAVASAIVAINQFKASGRLPE